LAGLGLFWTGIGAAKNATAFGAPGIEPRWTRSAMARIGTASPAAVRWSSDSWQTSQDESTWDSGWGCWFAARPTERLPAGARVVFTFRWDEQREGRDRTVEMAGLA